MHVCRGKCELQYHTSAKYTYGDRWRVCSICDLSILYDGIYCPCCGTKLRLKPRSRKHRNFILSRPEKLETNKKQLMGFDKKGNPILKAV